MLRYLKHHTLFIFFICFIIINCTCTDNNNRPLTYKSTEGYQEVQNSYNSVLKIWPVPYESKFVKTAYGQTHVITWGKKNDPPLVLFHGGGNCALMWIFIAEQLANSFYVIAPDTVGDVGLSVPIKPFITTDDYAEWFLELLNNMDILKVNIAGISWGGGIALQIVLKYPERINKMVIMCPAWGIDMFRIWALLYHSLPVAIFPNSERVRNLLEWLSVKRPAFADNKGDKIVNYLVTAFKNYKSPKSVQPIVFTDEELRQIKIPILLMIGDKEVIYSDPDKMIKRAKDTILNIKCKIIPKAGHALIYDRPEMTSQEIIRFIK